MGIMDGFWLYVGKTLAEIALIIGMCLLAFGVIFAGAFIAAWREDKKKNKNSRKG